MFMEKNYYDYDFNDIKKSIITCKIKKNDCVLCLVICLIWVL